MRIGEVAKRLGTTPHTIRLYERHGSMRPAQRNDVGYREYNAADVSRLRLLIGLRSLELPLDQAAELASLCADGKCDEVSDELRAAIAAKRDDIARRSDELRFLDHRLAHLAGQLEAGERPRPLISVGKEEPDAS